MDQLAVGAEISGRYALLERLPDGPFGERWRVSDTQGPEARLTLVRVPRALASAARARTLEAIRRFSHPYALAVSDAGLLGECPYFITPKSDGQALRAWLSELRARNAFMPLRDARTLVEQVAQVLGAAHRTDSGVAMAHGASLAASITIERRGATQFVVHVDDIGRASLRAEMPAESAPGASSEGPSAADDVYGLGALLAEVLTGDAFDIASDHDSVCSQLKRVRPEVHASVWDVVRECTRPTPADRPEDVARVRELIRNAVWTPGEVRVARKTAPPPPPPPPDAPLPTRARVVEVNLAPVVVAPVVVAPVVVAPVVVAPVVVAPVVVAPVAAAPSAPRADVDIEMATRLSLPRLALEQDVVEEGTASLAALSSDAHDGSQVDPIMATLRVKRSLLNAEKTEVSTPGTLLPEAAPSHRSNRSLLNEEATRAIDVDAMAPDAPIDTINTERQPHRAAQARRSTYVAVGGPDADGPVSPRPRRGATLRESRPDARRRVSPTIAVEDAPPVSTAAWTETATTENGEGQVAPVAAVVASVYEPAIEPTKPVFLPSEPRMSAAELHPSMPSPDWHRRSVPEGVAPPSSPPSADPPTAPPQRDDRASGAMPPWLIALGISLLGFLLLLTVYAGR